MISHLRICGGKRFTDPPKFFFTRKKLSKCYQNATYSTFLHFYILLCTFRLFSILLGICYILLCTFAYLNMLSPLLAHFLNFWCTFSLFGTLSHTLSTFGVFLNFWHTFLYFFKFWHTFLYFLNFWCPFSTFDTLSYTFSTFNNNNNFIIHSYVAEQKVLIWHLQ